jgi:amino acid permease
LQFAVKQGGWALNGAGLVAIAAWNVIAVQRLCLCLDYLPTAGNKTLVETVHSSYSDDEVMNGGPPSLEDDEANINGHASEEQEKNRFPPPGTSIMGQVAWAAFGKHGLEISDVLLFVLLMGVLVTYVVAATSFLSDTPLSLGRAVNAIVSGGIMLCLALVPDVGHLAQASAVGLLILLATFLVIAGYGVVDEDNTTPAIIPTWPASLTGLCQWFGVVVFGFGVVPLTYNFRSSMSRPEKMTFATSVALFSVAVAYIIMGVGLLYVYPELEGDVLHELPTTGVLPVITRLAMVWVVVVTAPLLLIPCGDLLEGKFCQSKGNHDLAMRFGVMIVAIGIALLFPSFVQVLSLVGCACVGTVGFILPPLFHLKLSITAPQTPLARQKFQDPKPVGLWVDIILLVWGIAATIISTTLTFRNATPSA